MIYIPPDILSMIEKVENEKKEIFLVGGCVRDSILGRDVSDYDLTTNATPDEMKEIFTSPFKYYETGIKHGTLTVKYNSTIAEITTYRKEDSYGDFRHPDNVQFIGNIEGDLSRRDFTMNSIAYNPKKGIVDPFGGKEDINNKIIRTVGNPKKRFTEDPLRILRALRFSAKLGFEIDAKTKEAIFICKDLLLNISKERITSEILYLLDYNYKDIINEYHDVFEVVLPGIKKVDYVVEGDAIARLTSIIMEIPDYDKYLVLSNSQKQSIKNIIANIDNFENISIPNALRLLKSVKYDDLIRICQIKNDELSKNAIDNAYKSAKPYSISMLEINGNDLLEINIQKEEIGIALNAILNLVIDEKIPNKKSDIINYIITNKDDFLL